MALRARNASPSGRVTLNPQSTCHGPRPGPKLAYWVRAGSLCATEPRARGKTRDRKRKKCRRVKKTHLYMCVSIYILIDMSFHVFQSQGYLVAGRTESPQSIGYLKGLSPVSLQGTWGGKSTESRQSPGYLGPERTEYSQPTG